MARKILTGKDAELAARFFAINEKRKALEKEEEAIREHFKDKAGGAEVLFTCANFEVPVTKESRAGVDLKALRLAFGPQLAKFETKTEYMKVAVRRVERDLAA